jgi:hypothetical protein
VGRPIRWSDSPDSAPLQSSRPSLRDCGRKLAGHFRATPDRPSAGAMAEGHERSDIQDHCRDHQQEGLCRPWRAEVLPQWVAAPDARGHVPEPIDHGPHGGEGSEDREQNSETEFQVSHALDCRHASSTAEASPLHRRVPHHSRSAQRSMVASFHTMLEHDQRQAAGRSSGRVAPRREAIMR